MVRFEYSRRMWYANRPKMGNRSAKHRPQTMKLPMTAQCDVHPSGSAACSLARCQAVKATA